MKNIFVVVSSCWIDRESTQRFADNVVKLGFRAIMLSTRDPNQKVQVFDLDKLDPAEMSVLMQYVDEDLQKGAR